MKFLLTVLLPFVLLPIILKAQDRPVINATISGRVTDHRTNEGLAGASVSIKGTTNGAITNSARILP